MLFIRSFVTFINLSFLYVALVNVVHAQQGTTLEEVIVTASKLGAQSLQDTVGTINAISEESLERSLVEGMDDYIKMIPGLTTVSSGTGQSQIVIRGVNGGRITHNQPQARSLAGLYLDDMPISVAAFNPDLGIIDVERIEVLKGPQGTLYGGSSMSGTIRLITKKPDTEKMAGKISANVSDTKGGDINYGYKGSLNLPISDKVAMIINGYSLQRSGFIDVVGPTPPSLSQVPQEDYNREDLLGGKVQLAYYGDKLDAHAAIMYHKVDAEGRADELVQDSTDPRLATITDNFQAIKFSPDPFTDEFLAFNFTFDYDFENINVYSSTSRTEVDTENYLDDNYRIHAFLPFSPFTDLGSYSDLRSDIKNEVWIEELRISSTYESRLQWIVGFYYEEGDKDFLQIQPTANNDAFFCGGMTPCAGASPDSIFDTDFAISSTQMAVFGEATYDLTDALKLKFGFRWFDYEHEAGFLVSGAANRGIITSSRELKEDGWVPKVEISYDIDEDKMVYMTYSEGFRLGSLNRVLPDDPVCLAELASLGLSPNEPVTSDSLKNYEIGAKTTWLDNRLTANVSVFHNQFEDIQTNIFLDCAFNTEANAGSIENTGFDADFAFQASEALSMMFGMSYIDSEVEEVARGVNTNGDTPPYVPEFSASGSIQYATSIWEGYGYIRGSVRHVGSTFNEFSSDASAQKLDAYTVVDLNLGYEQDGWGINVFARNLFDEDIVTNIDPDRLQPNQATRGRPRTVGVSVSKSF